VEVGRVAFMGELSDIGVSDLLYLLGLRRQTGKLSVSTRGEEVTLFLEKGQLSSVSSTNMGLRLGRMLIRLGYLDTEQLRVALREQETGEPARGLGTIVIERGWVTEEKLAQCIEEQCVEILARVIGADRGMLVFQRSASRPKQTESVPLNSDRIVLEAIRRTDERAARRGLLPDPGAPLLLSPTMDEVANHLSAPEAFVVASLRAGAASLAEIADSSVMEESVLQHAVIALRERGHLLVAVADDEPSLSDESPFFDDALASLDLAAIEELRESVRSFGASPSLV